MASYTKTELEEAKRAIVSTLNKCEKVLPKLQDRAAQQTLLARRIKALRISVDLIEKELLNLIQM